MAKVLLKDPAKLTFLIVIDHGYNSVRFKWEAVWKQILKVFFLD